MSHPIRMHIIKEEGTQRSVVVVLLLLLQEVVLVPTLMATLIMNSAMVLATSVIRPSTKPSRRQKPVRVEVPPQIHGRLLLQLPSADGRHKRHKRPSLPVWTDVTSYKQLSAI